MRFTILGFFTLLLTISCASSNVVSSSAIASCEGAMTRDRLAQDTHECYPAPFGVGYRQDASASARFLFEHLLGKNRNRKVIAEGLLREHAIHFQQANYLPLEIEEGQAFLLHYDPKHLETLTSLYKQVSAKWTPEQLAALRFSERPPAKTIPMYRLSKETGYETGQIAWSGADIEIGALLKSRIR